MNSSFAFFAATIALCTSLYSQGPSGDLRTGPLIMQEAYLKAESITKDDLFGSAVAVDGNTVVIGSPLEDSNATGVNGDWSNNLSYNSGAAFVYVRINGEWQLQAYLKPETIISDGLFGSSVAISGDVIVVGAPNNAFSNTKGRAVVFRRTGNVWALEETIQGFKTEIRDQFGASVDISNNNIVVGAPFEDGGSVGVGGDQNDNSVPDSGCAYVFVKTAANGWRQKAYFKSIIPGSQDYFGASVSISKDTLIVGAPNEDSNAVGVNDNPYNNRAPNSGAAFVYSRGGGAGQWSMEAYLKASNTDAEDHFGSSVSIANDGIVIGAPDEDSSGSGVNSFQDNGLRDSGAAYIFVRKAGGNWNFNTYLKQLNTKIDDGFGTAVSNFGNVVAVGSIRDDSPSYGAAGRKDSTLASKTASGSVQVYFHTEGLWIPLAYVKAMNSDPDDLFGSSVAFANGILVAGSPMEGSSAVGVDGNGANNSISDGGAAYCINVAPNWGLARYGPYYGPNYADLFSYDHPVAGESFTFQAKNFNSSGTARLLLSRAPDWVIYLGGVFHVDRSPRMLLVRPGKFLWMDITMAAAYQGRGTFTLNLPAAAAGFTFYAQAAMHDPTQPTRWALTNGLKIVVGP
jgi:trimeric autotransporter adhesin